MERRPLVLDRGKFLSRLSEKMGGCEELRSWWGLFHDTEARLVTAWGNTTVKMRRGIRQGSVESPQVFATAMDWILRDVSTKWGWDATKDVYQGLEFAESAFVDDCILWNGSTSLLETRAQQVTHELARWGLKVNPEKCQVYRSPFAKESGPLKVDTLEVTPDDRLDVMGIPFHVGISPELALQGVFQRTKNKFWALKHLFRAKTAISGRMKLMQKILGGTSLWCVSAFLPDKAALHCINSLHAQITCWAMRLAWRSDETWFQFKIRTLRAARACIHAHHKERWSTMWL